MVFDMSVSYIIMVSELEEFGLKQYKSNLAGPMGTELPRIIEQSLHLKIWLHVLES